MNSATLILTAVLIAATMLAYRRRAWPLVLGFAVPSLLFLRAVVEATPWPVLAGVGALGLGVGWHRWGRTSATVTRWSARNRRKSGVASSLDIARVSGSVAMRRKAASVRPSLATTTRRARARQLLMLPVAEVGVRLCTVGAQSVYASVEEVVVTFGGPRTGKTQWLAGRVIDAPGAVLVTSTRIDVYEQTRRLRERRGPVYVFNAVGLAGIPSSIMFDPLTGCADPVTANDRATDMIGAASSGGGDREFWDGQGRRVLAALLHAAALDPDGETTMGDVLRWVSNPTAAESEVTRLLRRSTVSAMRDDAVQFVTTNDKTRSSITSTIMPALGWLTSPAAAAAGAAGGTPFDVAELLASRATVYLLGGEETQAAPLVCALTGYIAREARRVAATKPGGRLDPPLMLALDEAALISPVPLDRWTSDMGGRGVCIIAAFQSRAQMLDRYGSAKTAAILNNTGARILFGGTADRDDLDFWSKLSGDRDEPTLTTDMRGRVASRTTYRVPVISPAQLANLHGRVVVFRRGMPPVIGRAEMAYRRRDVRELALDPNRRTARARRAVRAGCAQVRAWRPRRGTAQVPGPTPASLLVQATGSPADADATVPEGLHLVPTGPAAGHPGAQPIENGHPRQRPAVESDTTTRTATGTDDDQDGWT